MVNIKFEIRKDRHIDVGHPNKGKESDDIAAPVRIQQLEARHQQKCRGHVMTETVFTGKQVEEFALPENRLRLAQFLAVVPWLSKYLFMGDGP